MSSSKNKKKGAPSVKHESPSLDFLTTARVSRRFPLLQPETQPDYIHSDSGGGSGGGLERRPSKKLGHSSDRLPSVRPKRDLTLGGVPKKSFTPTIPTSRRIKKETEGTEATPGKKGREERKEKRERAKRKGKEIITSASVFSMGPADRGLTRGRGGGGSGGGGGVGGGTENDIRFAKKPDFLTSKTTTKPELTADDENTDPVQGESIEELFSNSNHPPTQLPLDYQLHTKTRIVAPKQVKVIKPESIKEESIKVEPMDLSNGEKMDTTDQSGPVKTMLAPPTVVNPQHTKVSDLFTPEDPSKGQFLFLQLPDCLPTKVNTSSDRERSDCSANGSTTTGSKNPEDTTADTGEERHCSLRDLPEGLIGKLRVHKSGKVRLCLGEVSFDVAIGTPCGFLQELVSVRQEKPESKLTVLGQLSHRLVCTPDFESILEQSEHR